MTPPSTPSPGLLAGVHAAFAGLRHAWSMPDVGRAYAALSIALLITTTLLDIGGIAALWSSTAAAPEASWWLEVGLLALRGVGIVVVLFVAPIVALVLVNNLAPVLAERIFLAGLRSVSPARADALAAAPGLPLGASITASLLRLGWFLGCSVSTLLLSFVPVLGTAASPVLQGFFSARAIGWELLDPYFDKCGMGFSDQRGFVNGHRWPIVGFGLPLGFAMAIPLAGPWFFGLAQAAAGRFVGEVLEARGSTP